MQPTLKEFALLVQKLRTAQRGYFKAQPGTAAKYTFLDESKKLEKQVDQALEDVLTEQRSLFEDDT
jgi:hypothetical protein